MSKRKIPYTTTIENKWVVDTCQEEPESPKMRCPFFLRDTFRGSGGKLGVTLEGWGYRPGDKTYGMRGQVFGAESENLYGEPRWKTVDEAYVLNAMDQFEDLRKYVEAFHPELWKQYRRETSNAE